MWKLSVAVSLWAALSTAISLDEHAVFEEVNEPEQWKPVGEPADATVLEFKIALQAADPAALVRNLQDISSPNSKKHGQHLSAEELQAVLKPSDEAKEVVHSWLKRSGVKDIVEHADGQWIHYSATAQQANAMMATKFLRYRHVDSERPAQAIRTRKVLLPRNVMPHIKMIHPTTRFVQIRAQESAIMRVKDDDLVVMRFANGHMVPTGAAAPAQSCNKTMTPSCLREVYNIKGVDIADPSKVGSIGVAGFLGQLARFNDLEAFTKSQAKWAVGANFSVTVINGGITDQTSPANANEANLDIQYTVGISHPVPNKFYTVGGRGPFVPDISQPDEASQQNEPYLEWLQYLLSTERGTNLPHTLSISYGENEQSIPPTYAKTICDLIAQLGARGTSVIISSGDTGIGSGCLTNDGKNTTRFLPIFPASCPYATSVGGTAGINPERAVSFSSGGFSDLWDRPWYQDSAVPAFLQTLGAKWAGLYNSAGRGFPDIAAQSVDFNVIDKGRLKRISGTSASAPVVAGIVGLLNAQRLQSGQPTLGFLNPWLYETGRDMLTDIVDGGSTGCSGRDMYSGAVAPYVPDASWQAVKGWDAVTGLGTPRFDRMLAALPKAGTGYGQVGSQSGSQTTGAPQSPVTTASVATGPVAPFPPTGYGLPKTYRNSRYAAKRPGW